MQVEEDEETGLEASAVDSWRSKIKVQDKQRGCRRNNSTDAAVGIVVSCTRKWSSLSSNASASVALITGHIYIADPHLHYKGEVHYPCKKSIKVKTRFGMRKLET